MYYYGVYNEKSVTIFLRPSFTRYYCSLIDERTNIVPKFFLYFHLMLEDEICYHIMMLMHAVQIQNANQNFDNLLQRSSSVNISYYSTLPKTLRTYKGA